MLRAVAAALVLVLVLVLAAAGCAGSDTPSSGTSGSPAAVGGAVRTYGSTVLPVGPARLLSVEEAREFVFLGFDIREQPVLDPKQFVVTTLRGPCGAPIATPFRAQRGEFKVYRSTIALIIETMAEPGPAVVTSFLDAATGDATDGCAAFAEQIGSAGSSQVQLVRMLDLPGISQQSVGWVQQVTAPDGKVGYRTIVLLGNGGRAVMLAVLTQTEPEDVHLRNLVTAVASAR